MSENRIATLPSGASRARSGRSTSAQSARSSIDERTAAPNPSLRMMFAVCHIGLDRLAAAGQQRVAGVDPAAQLVGLASGAVEQDGHTTITTASIAATTRQHVGDDLRTGHRSSIGC